MMMSRANDDRARQMKSEVTWCTLIGLSTLNINCWNNSMQTTITCNWRHRVHIVSFVCRITKI